MFETVMSPGADERQWWREPELAIILLIAVVTFCVRLDALPLFGEETRRAQIAREMVETGDWLVPGTQRIFLPSRPPLQNWLIAFVGLVNGSFDLWAARIPSVLATVVASMLLYGYLRQLSGRLGSLTGSVAFLTMTLVMEFGRSAETEAVFSLFVAASLLQWHWGWMKNWPTWQLWSVGYLWTALGMLTKGLQAPLYFVGATFVFLILTKNWRTLFSMGHLIGIAVFIGVVGAWQGPFTLQRGLEDSWNIYFGDVAGRFVDRSWSVFIKHLIVFPCELLFVRLMPWSILLLAYCSRRVRRFPPRQQDSVIFLTVCILFSFVSVWLPPGSKVRYYMPLFPCFAALIGVAVDRLSVLPPLPGRANVWAGYLKFMMSLMVGSALFILAVSIGFPSWRVSLSLLSSLGYAAAAFGLAFVTWKSLRKHSDRAMLQGVISIAAFLALVEVCLIVTVQQRRCEDIAGQLAELKLTLPSEAQLVSLGPVHHAFAYFYEEPIPVVANPSQLVDGDVEYFCMHTYESEPPELPFHWTQVAIVSCDRLKSRGTPRDRVFVARRWPIQHVGMSRLQVPPQ